MAAIWGGVIRKAAIGCGGVKDRVFERVLWKVDQLDDCVRRRLVRCET